MLGILFAYALLATIFVAGTYALSQLLAPIRILFWLFVGMVFLGCVLPAVLSGQAIGLGLAIAASTAAGAYLGTRRSD